MRYTIYVPTEPKNSGTVRQHIKHKLSLHFGRYTAHEAKSGRVNEDGILIQESVEVIWAVSFEPEGTGYILYSLADFVKQQLNQTCVLVEFGERAELV